MVAPEETALPYASTAPRRSVLSEGKMAPRTRRRRGPRASDVVRVACSEVQESSSMCGQMCPPLAAVRSASQRRPEPNNLTREPWVRHRASSGSARRRHARCAPCRRASIVAQRASDQVRYGAIRRSAHSSQRAERTRHSGTGGLKCQYRSFGRDTRVCSSSSERRSPRHWAHSRQRRPALRARARWAGRARCLSHAPRFPARRRAARPARRPTCRPAAPRERVGRRP